MRIAVLGAGPAGLYFAILWKSRHPDAEVTVYEQNPSDATFGFGVVFSEQALDFLHEDDPATYDLITPCLETWRDMRLFHRGDQVRIDGVGFSSIGRLRLLQLLQKRAAAVGARLNFSRSIDSLDDLGNVDLIVGADGVNSLVRRTFEGDFGASWSYLNNKFAWYGTTKVFEALSQTFVETSHGAFNAHHFRYAPDASTFIIECDRATWERAGFAEMPPDHARAFCEDVFAATLDGHKLISNRSAWRNFPRLSCSRWSFRNAVLVGDALHTAHFSIGSGTRLALEDVIALVKALDSTPDLATAFSLYETARRPILEKLVRAANASADWYEHFPEHMRHSPLDLAYSYIMRSGRIDDERLRKSSPAFMTAIDRHRATQSG